MMDGYVDQNTYLAEPINPSTFEVRQADNEPDDYGFFRNQPRGLFHLKDLSTRFGETYDRPKAFTYTMPRRSQANAAVPTVSVDDMVKHAQAILGLNMHQIAKLVGVSRAALYKHLKDTSPREIDQYQNLYDVSLAVERQVPRGIKKGLKNIVVNGRTLLDHLKQDLSNPDRIAQLAMEVDRKMQETVPARAASKAEARARVHSVTRQG